MTDPLRAAFENSVIERMKESGFLEIQIRVECLNMRVGDGYQDEVINAGWHYWQAATTAAQAQLESDAFTKLIRILSLNWVESSDADADTPVRSYFTRTVTGDYQYSVSNDGTAIASYGCLNKTHHSNEAEARRAVEKKWIADALQLISDVAEPLVSPEEEPTVATVANSH